MSRSSRHASKRSRRSRTPGESELSVTEASFQSLHLTTPSTATEHLSVLPAYQHPAQTFRRSSYQEDLSSTYLQPTYNTTGFPIASPSPSGSFTDPTADFGNPSDFQLNPDPDLYDTRQVRPTADMSNTYGYAPSPVLRSQTEHRSYNPTMQPMQGYSFNSAESQRRSMSGSHGPRILSGLAFSGPSTEEREIARQRRRGLQQSRRQSKIHARRTRLPSTIGARQETQIVGNSVDVTAASSHAPYISAPLESSSSYGTQPLAPAAPRDYMGSISGSSSHYDVNVYPPAYGMSTVNTQASYAPSQPSGLRAPSDASLHPYSSGRSHSSGGHSVSPKPESSVRVVGSREKPQCWEHGCNGREFSTFSNLLRHQREKSGTATKSYCPRCGAEFTRTTARNGHMAHEKCKPRRGSSD